MQIKECFCFALIFSNFFFSFQAFGLSFNYATGATQGSCPGSDASYAYAPYDSRCATHVAPDFSGTWRWRYDYTLGPSDDGARVTIVPSLAGAIASIKTSDSQEFVHSGNHGSAFTLTIHPDTVDSNVFKNEYITSKNPSGFTECYNPTEEGSHLDDVKIQALKPSNRTQGHGVSSSRINSWTAGSLAGRYDWFNAEIWFANYWPEILGFNNRYSSTCSPIPGNYASGVMSRFSSLKSVRLGRLTDSNGKFLAKGFSNYLTVDRIISIDPSEPRHKRIAGSEILYLANNPVSRQSYFTSLCMMTNPDSLSCTDQSTEAISKNRNVPVVVSDKSFAHSIGTIAVEPHWVNEPIGGAKVRFLNIHAGRNADSWKNMVLIQNWIVEGNGPHWIGRTGSDKRAIAFRTRHYYAIGSRDKVIRALADLRRFLTQ